MKPAPLNWPPKAINANYWGDPFLLQWTHNAKKRIWVKVQTCSCNKRSLSKFHCLPAIRLSHYTFENDMTITYFKDVAKSGFICQRFPTNWSMSKKHNWVLRLSSPCWLKGGGTGMVSWSKAIPLRWDGLHLAIAQLSNYPFVHTKALLRATHCKPI